jgi:hypothetical protein
MKVFREVIAFIEMTGLFIVVWAVVFGIPLGLGALARLAGAGQ